MHLHTRSDLESPDRYVLFTHFVKLPVTTLTDDIQKERDEVLSVKEKLAAVEAEALEAQQATSHGSGSSKRKHGKTEPMRKRSRRRSTLSPDELVQLMGIE